MNSLSAKLSGRRASRTRAALTGLMLGLMHAPQLLADDTEIFVQALPPGTPNVLLIIDTSGSMSSDVVVGTDYDPDVVYPGSCPTGESYYYTRSSTGDTDVPSCNPIETSRRVLQSAFTCDSALQALNDEGIVVDRFAQWDPNEDQMQWEKLVIADSGDPPGQSRLVECEDDYGEHGDGLDTTSVYPTQGDNGPWSDTEGANSYDWATADLYTFYHSNYLNWLEAERDTAIKSRLEVVKDVSEGVVATISGVRLGVMRFSQDGQGGMVVYPVSDLSPATRLTLIDAVRALEPDGVTPLAETMFEAHQYYAGENVDFGLNSKGNNGVAQPSHADSTTANGEIYISPITQQCQKNYVVLLTDGLPVSDTGADVKISDLTGSGCSGSCLDEVAKYMAETDMGAPEPTDEQTVGTYTIGFFTDDNLLRETATAQPDDSDYFLADGVESLTTAFIETFEDIGRSPDTFSSPAISVDSFNRLTNRDDLFFTLFVPSARPHWDGNIKKYRLGGEDGQTIIDIADVPAVNDLGLFQPGTRSYWTEEADGSDVTKGGVRNRLGIDRNIYTNLTGITAVSLTAPDNSFSIGNSQLDHTLLNVDDDERDALINLVHGIDEDGDPAPVFGDSLHGVPILVTFAGGDVDNPDQMLFAITNDGMFHAIDVTPDADPQLPEIDVPMEEFSFIPRELLGELLELRDNDVVNPTAKAYGLDGPMSYWIDGDDGDAIVDSDETLYLYFGMRRGGRNYYAIKIPGNDRANPQLAWTIRGGTGDYQSLGQTWSALTVADLDLTNHQGTVLIAGGGYDASAQDLVGPTTEDTVGRAIFAIEPRTGNRIWWAGNPADAGAGTPNVVLAGMTNSVPSTVRVVDTNVDGFADRMYVGDMGGRIWRLDINEQGGSGAVFANLGGAGNSNNRRFYYAPSVARVVDPTFGSFLTISIGSGHRPGPLSPAVNDSFFMLKDADVFAPPRDENGDISYRSPIVLSDLLDITNDVNPSVAALSAERGWRLRLTTPAEKVLAPALTADNKVFFTTYVPGSTEPNCDFGGVLGGGRLYSVQLLSGAPVVLDDSIDPDELAPEDRFQELDRRGIPPQPVPIFTPPKCTGEDCEPPDDPPLCPPEDPDCGDEIDLSGCDNPFSQVTLLVATQTVNPNICNAPVRTYWSQGGVNR